MISAKEAREKLMEFNEVELKQLEEIDNMIKNKIKDGRIEYKNTLYPAVYKELERLGYIIDHKIMRGIEQISCHINW